MFLFAFYPEGLWEASRTSYFDSSGRRQCELLGTVSLSGSAVEGELALNPSELQHLTLPNTITAKRFLKYLIIYNSQNF